MYAFGNFADIWDLEGPEDGAIQVRLNFTPEYNPFRSDINDEPNDLRFGVIFFQNLQ